MSKAKNINMKSQSLILLTVSILVLSCKKDKAVGGPALTIENNFNQNFESWIPGFSDYPVGQEAFFELQSAHKPLPAPLDQTDGSIFISGNNHSDDLLMFLKKQITGLKPNQAYRAKFYIDFASNAPSNVPGVGGSPGENVALGIGISPTEYDNVVINNNYRINLNIGNQVQSGPYKKVIGNVANGTNTPTYVLLKKEGDFEFTTDISGKVWAFICTDSGFEATTALYYSRIKIEFFEL